MQHQPYIMQHPVSYAHLFSFISLYLSIYSTGDDSQPMLLTHKSEIRVYVCLHNISCFCLIVGRISLLLSAGCLVLYQQWLKIIVVLCFFDSGSRSVALYGASHVTAAVRYVGSPHPADGPSLSGRHCDRMILSHRLH